MAKQPKKRVSPEADHAITRMAESPGGAAAFFRKPVTRIAIVVVLGMLIYSNSFNVPFILDDLPNIADNPAIRDFQSVFDSYRDNRIIGKLTFAVNYRLHGLHVAGYHVVNLLIHLINALLVYWLVTLTFRTPYAADHFPKDTSNTSAFDRWIPFLTALLFVSHPIQTQAVTYIVQRLASLATLFYLFSFVMYIKARGSASSKRVRYACYAASVVSAILAMRTKEIAFTLPFMIIIYEFMFLRGELKRRLLYLSSFILTIPIIPLALTGFRGFSRGAGGVDEITGSVSVGLSRWDYLITQFRVIVTYIRLLLFPVNQNLDYEYPLHGNFFHPEVLLSFLFLLALMGMGIYLFYRSSRSASGGGFWMRLTALGIFWFLVTISVESSIIPLADFIFEHRLYLPSIGFFLTVMAGVTIVHKWMTDHKMGVAKVIMPAMIMVVAVMSVTAYARNAVWHDEITLWEDARKKSPHKFRPNYNTGRLYQDRGRPGEAIEAYRTAIVNQPDFAEVYRIHYNLGLIYQSQGNLDEAFKAYRTALEHKQDFAEAHYNLGLIYQSQGNLDEAITAYQTAIKFKPAYPEAYTNMGGAYFIQGLLREAAAAYQMAIEINPDFPEVHNAHYNLGLLYHKQGRLADAVEEYQLAIRHKPEYANAHLNLGFLYRQQGRLDAALKEFQVVLNIDPDHKEARKNLEQMRLSGGNRHQ